MGSSSQEKKRKSGEKSEALEAGDRIEPQALTPAIDTSNWPLLLKVCPQRMVPGFTYSALNGDGGYRIMTS